ncbi:LysR family transcriptional regulator [Streptomyces sp. NBC_00243]|uniref:LysR family transcriptional regulator n=1 Tax=Streptomyces sp. NBC_00243 TaxID=2975688 RepID=UPI002DD8C4BF|nr:LysR family transcriptional regulator [Streptomyces sp. NBC_00243]WRZ24840.1 LysR family transcriptional regulator [Streptomyces sp. NBC_00243]
MDLGGLDMNALTPLHALLEVRHVTRAAERCHMSQPTMSAYLARLRRYFDDELLVRGASGYELTPLGHRLLPLVAEVLTAAESVFRTRAGFDPLTSERRFVISCSGYATSVIGRPLNARLGSGSPALSIQFCALKDGFAERDLLEADLVIAPLSFSVPAESEKLFSDDFVCLLDSGNPVAAEAELTAEVLSGLRHAGVSRRSGTPTVAHRLIDGLGVQGRLAVLTDEWANLPWLVQDTDLVALLPRRVAERASQAGGFTIREVPGYDGARFTESMLWHSSRNADPGLRWLRGELRAALGTP